MASKKNIPSLTVHTMDDGTTLSTVDRAIKDVVAPNTFLPTKEQFYSAKDPSKPDLEFLRSHLIHEGRLTEEQAIFIIKSGGEVLRREPTLLEIDAPITGIYQYY
jgi:serine/threonine-protein phosphatase 2B catalytic subunit